MVTKFQNDIALRYIPRIYRNTMTDSCPSWPAIDSYRDLGLDSKIIHIAPRSLSNEVIQDPFPLLEVSRKKSYKMFVIVILLAIIQGQIASNEVELPTPYLHRATFRDPLQFIISWNALDSGLKEEPVLGYKVHVWEREFIPRHRYEEVNGEIIRIPDSPRRRKLRLQKAHYTNSTYVIEGANTTTYRQENIKLNITYEVKAQVYTNFRDGPLSQPSTFTMH